ncbi:M48 family metallopeptidase [Deltaproteobacteria bacterium IMCC39524]|nr:M48 family metallopeptidase [Deltaproteobacteria bacterium IMCC39524]
MKWLLLTLYLLVLACRLWLRHLNLQHLKAYGQEVPAGFEGIVDRQLLARTSAYTLATSRVGLIESLFSSLLLLLFVFGGLLAWYNGLIVGVTTSFVGQGCLFVLGLLLAQTLIDIPFSLYRTFVIEERFQFNTSTPKLWITDLLKSLAVGMILLSLLTAGSLALVQASPKLWWLWVWGLFALMTLILMYLSPVLIEPLFFKFQPLQDQALAERVKDVMKQAGLQVERVQQVDASRRSKHSNAYFTGIGRVKRIVLFDTLLEQMSDDEILGVLAHEAGHWKLGHIWKRLLSMELVSLVVCWSFWRVLSWDGLSGWFGLVELSFLGKVLLVGFLASLVSFPLTPFSSLRSRRHEWQADQFARNLTGEPGSLASALVKLCKENLSNLHPHPFYAWFYYSHPPVVERIARLTGTERRL